MSPFIIPSGLKQRPGRSPTEANLVLIELESVFHANLRPVGASQLDEALLNWQFLPLGIDLYNGLAGIGSGFLRLHDRASTPPVLLLDPPRPKA